MDKQDLIAYLEEEKAQRQSKITEYGDACERLEIAKSAYEDAQRIVDNYGDITSVNAEIDKINGFISLLTEENKAEDTVATDGVREDCYAIGGNLGDTTVE